MFSRDDKTATAPVAPAATDTSAAARPQHHPAPAAVRTSSEASLISAALKITGQLESAEDIQIEGQVEGDIRARKVSIGTKAIVKGTIYADDVDVAGTVTGKIEAKSVVLAKTAHVSGDILHEVLQVDKGAFLDGNCRPHHSERGAQPHAVKTVEKPVAVAAKTA
jgi:cytoskeletal protein CcmA (bactofilin family)